MGADQFFYLVIVICLGLAIVMMFPRFFKITAKILLNAGLGLGIIYAVNNIIPNESYFIGLNFFTGSVTGLLGLPGVVLLYVVKLFG